MSNRFLGYLQREHQRLEQALTELQRRKVPDSRQIATLKKQKLAVKDQIEQWRRDCANAA